MKNLIDKLRKITTYVLYLVAITETINFFADKLETIQEKVKPLNNLQENGK